VIFYRPVSCIPRDFTLIGPYDTPRVFGRGPQTVDSFSSLETGIGLDTAGPMQLRSRGLGAVPIWYFPSNALDDDRTFNLHITSKPGRRLVDVTFGD
jgi:hypothetical protein